MFDLWSELGADFSAHRLKLSLQSKQKLWECEAYCALTICQPSFSQSSYHLELWPLWQKLIHSAGCAEGR